MNPYLGVALVWIVLAVAAALVIGPALRHRRRDHLGRRRTLEAQLGRPLTAAEVWDLAE